MHFRPPFRGCFRICGHDKSAPTAACGLPFRCERFVNNATLTHEIGCEHSARRRGPIHRARILTLSNIHIRITKYVHSHHRTHISTLSITCIHIIKYVHSFYYTHISVCHFVGVFIYAGTINRSPTAADGLPFRCKRISITLRTPTKWGANTPPGVGADSSRPYPNIIKYLYSRHQIRVSVSPHAHFHITTRTYPFAILWVFSYTRAR